MRAGSERAGVRAADSRFDELVSFADEAAVFCEDLGLPRAWGRVLGWLMVCEPDHQSADDLAAVLHMSSGGISAATRALIRLGYVERLTKRGDRRIYYRIRPGAWTGIFEQLIQIVTGLSLLAERGLGLLNDEQATQRQRLRELHDLSASYERESLALLARGHHDRRQKF
jgi:DNA-binding MarR family transcriptional regulator